MDTEAKRAWVEALRSGKYEQGEGALKIERLDAPPQFCCLGVYCDIAPELEWHNGTAVIVGSDLSQPEHDDDWDPEREYYSDHEDGSFFGTTELPTDLLDALGLTEDDQVRLIHKNDGYTRNAYARPEWQDERKHTFAEIADWIEENL
jgi:hypothetical protein